MTKRDLEDLLEMVNDYYNEYGDSENERLLGTFIRELEGIIDWY